MSEIQHLEKPVKQLTGRAVLFGLIAFFGVVFAVNAVMIRFATQTFGGVETASSYKAGLAFRQEEIAAQAQDAEHWQVNGHIVREADGRAVLTVIARDAGGRVIPGWSASARLIHPADARRDAFFALDRTGSDVARGTAHAEAGQWDLMIDIEREGARVFRSRSRIVLR